MNPYDNAYRTHVEVDMKNGYKQLGVHRIEWHAQVYSPRKREYYMEFHIPFGKVNSKVFCQYTTASQKALIFLSKMICRLFKLFTNLKWMIFLRTQENRVWY